MTKPKTTQWNLNQAIGWESPNPEDMAVLFIKWTQPPVNSDHIAIKRKFDESVLQELKANRIGDQAENDEENETDFLFVVYKDYQKAVAVIVSVAETYNIERQITVYKREYEPNDNWTDKVVYPD